MSQMFVKFLHNNFEDRYTGTFQLFLSPEEGTII